MAQSSSRTHVVSAAMAVVASVLGCGPARPPADLAPDPGLAARITAIDVDVVEGAVCPGGAIRASYTATLDDGSVLPFSSTWDEDDPPPLHVIMLRRSSPEATPRENGDWVTDPDPLRSAMTGFRLTATLKVRTSLSASETVAPDYSCGRHDYTFFGRTGPRGGAGENGPDLTVRLGVVSSPWYDRLLVAGIEVGLAPPFYLVADADRVPPADWLRIATRGGRGGKGVDGSDGQKGADGEAGCPGSPGGAGGAGGNGGPGGRGGRGGRVVIYAPDADPFLAGLVDAESVPGPGGGGGAGGAGGPGGKGGEATTTTSRRCQPGADGSAGPQGSDGSDGPPGMSSAPSEIVTLPLGDVFGPRAPGDLYELIDYRG